MFLAVSVRGELQRAVSEKLLSDGEFTQMMKGLQGERLRQAFKYLDHDQDGFILPDQFKRIIMVRTNLSYMALLLIGLQEIAGHKLSDAVIQRLPTLCTITPGGRITYSEVNAFHNVVRGGQTYLFSYSLANECHFVPCRDGYDRTVSMTIRSDST